MKIAWSDTTGCAIPISLRPPSCAKQSPRRLPISKNLPLKFTPAKSPHPPAKPSRNSSSSASEAPHSDRNSSPKRSAATPNCRSISSTTPTPPAWTRCWKKSNRSVLPTRSCWSFQNPAEPPKPAMECSKRKPHGKRRNSTSASTRSRSPAPVPSSINTRPHKGSSPPSPWRNGSADALLFFQPSASCPPPCKASTSTNFSPVQPRWMWKHARPMRNPTPRCSWPLHGIT